MAELDTNFVDAVLSANMNGKKRVRLTQIAENEYIVEDITEYEKVGSEYGQKEINTLNETVNGKVNKVEVIDDLDTVKAVTEDNVPVGCKAVTKLANDVNQSLTNLNDSKKTYLRLVLPNLAADAKTVCDYINKNYLMGQITPMYSIEFDVVASNVDWFSGVLSTDTNVDSNARTVWGIVQKRSISADNSTLYKYFASGTGGVGSVSALDHVKSFIDVSTILKSYTTIAAGATVTYTATRDCFVNVSAYAHGSGQNTKIYIDNVHVFNPYTNNGDNAGLMIVDKTVPLKTGQTIKIENGTYTTSSYAIFAAF